MGEVVQSFGLGDLFIVYHNLKLSGGFYFLLQVIDVAVVGGDKQIKVLLLINVHEYTLRRGATVEN